MTSSTRDGWERLVAAVLKREQFRQLSRLDSISTVSSGGFSGRILSFSSNGLKSPSVSPSPVVHFKNPTVSQGGSIAASGPIKWKLFNSWFKRGITEDKYLVNIPEDLRMRLGLLRRFSLHELQVATENFTYKCGARGGFSMTYKGQLADGSRVAVERHLDRGFQTAAQQMLEKVKIDSFVSHPNIINLLGFCITPKEWMLVYPLMVNGSVAHHLRGMHEPPLPLSWPVRKGIALGAAKGLVHLHEECEKKILHRDIKAANILLNEDFEAVIANLKMGIIVEHDVIDVEDVILGTVGHIAPEYIITCKFSEKNDVFGYGTFLLELIKWQRAFDFSRDAIDEEVMLMDWVKGRFEEKKRRVMIDAGCGEYIDEEVEQMIRIALACMRSDPEARPKMSEVVRVLQVDAFAEKWEDWCSEADMCADADKDN